ncbi:MAG: hypothetical protein QG673_2218 [Pseudomonadota bacterium]|nr:hypothetical protein [Pseudomonadota bacterium]
MKFCFCIHVLIYLLLPISNLFAIDNYYNENNIENSKNYDSILWYKTSAEKIAIYREIFELSKPILLNAKKNKIKSGYVCGVVFDIDETILDSSEFNYKILQEGKEYGSSSWKKYANASKYTIAIPGASDITNYVHSIGCIVNIVTNRSTLTLLPTKEILNKYNIYYDQILFVETGIKDKDKNSRFKAIINGKYPSKIKYKQQIIAYYGDNIQDFPDSYQKNYFNKDSSNNIYDKFGTEYFCLPNPMYGSWTNNKINNN